MYGREIEALLQSIHDDESTFDSSDDSDWDSYDYGTSDDDISDYNDGREAVANDEEDRTGLKARMNLLLSITEMKEQLREATQSKGRIRNVIPYPPDTGDGASVISMMSVDAIAKLKKKLNPSPISQTMFRSASMGILNNRIVDINQEKSAQDESTCIAEEDESRDMNPDVCLSSILKNVGIESAIRPASSLEGFFYEWSDDNIAAYHSELITAIKANNVAQIEVLHGMGRQLLGCNKFGESVVHMMCRHGSTEVLEYYLAEGVPIRLKDDSGRTPLHDACWTGQPNFACVKLFLKACPDMLLISDNRGFTPMAYVPRRCWSDWCSFLEDNKELLKPRELF